MALTLGELLDQPAFGLELRTGDQAARDRVIDGVHCLELVDPVPWLQEGWVMMTAGAQLRDDVTAQRQVVERAEAGGIAAIGVGLKAFVPDVPEALLDEAERRRFPVFSAPYETPFREIVQYVNQSVLSHEIYVFRRLSWMQQYLLHSLHEPEAVLALVDRLSGLMNHAAVGCATIDGDLVAVAGELPEWPKVSPHCNPERMIEVEIDGRWGLIAPVVVQDRLDSWLFVFARSQPLDRGLTKPLIESAANLLALLFSTQRNAAHTRKEMRARLAMRAFNAAEDEPDPGLSAALAAEGIDLTEPCRVAVLAPVTASTGGGPEPEAIRDLLETAIDFRRLDAIASRRGDRVLLLAQGELTDLDRWFEGQQVGIVAGVSDPFLRIETIQGAIDQAEVALAMTTQRTGEVTVQHHKDLDPEVLLISEARSHGAQEGLEEFLAPLAESPPLLEAVEAYLAADLDVTEAAASLHLHRNSLRNRLVRVEEVLGRSLRSSATIAVLHLALTAHRLNRDAAAD